MIVYNNTAFIPTSLPQTASPSNADSLFRKGLYYYANQDRKFGYDKEAESIFGANLIPFHDEKYRNHAIGNAVISRAGFANNPYGYYAAQGKQIPDNIKEAGDLYRYIGAEAILEQRKLHDEYEKRRKAKADNQAIYDSIVPRYLKNEINLSDIAPDYIEKLNQAGFSIKDLHTARHIVNAYRKADTDKEHAAILASDIASINGSNIKNVRSLVTQALSEDFARWRQENAGFTWERMREAFRNMIDSTAKLNSLDTPDETGAPKDTLQAIYNLLGADDTVPADLLKNRLVFLDAITNGRLQGIESYQEDTFGDAMGDVSTTLIELLPWLNPATIALPASDIYFKTLGRGFALQQDFPAGRIQDNDIADKARWTTYANVAAMGNAASRIGKAAGRFFPGFPKLFGRAAATWPGAAAAATLGGTINFGVYIPFVTSLLNWTYDTVANVPVDLRTGAEEWASFIEQTKSGRYWLTQASIGAITGAPGINATRKHWQHMLADRNTFLSRGGTEQQAKLTDSLPVAQRQKERQRLINENFAASPEAALKLAIQNSKSQVNREKATQMRQDEAVKAALHLDGYELVNREDGNVDLYYEGEASPDGSFSRGTKKMTFSPVEADTFIQSYMAPRLKAVSKALRSRSATESLVDAFVKAAQDPIDISYFRGTDTVQKMKQRAEKAQEIIESRVKQLTEDGMSEAEARSKALQEKHNSVSKDLTLQDAITSWQSMEQRIKQEQARSAHLKNNNNLGSRAYVITRPQHQDSPGAIRRILRISEDASPREMAEEYAEDWLASYLAENNYTTADAYRFLNDLQSALGSDIPKLLSTQELDPSLHNQLVKADDNYTPEQAQSLRRDVREAFSLLMLSDLMQKAMEGHADIPDWAAPFFSGADLPLAEMQRELTIGAAIKQARAEGWGDEAQQKLLNAPAKAVANALTARSAIPDASTYIRDYYAAIHRQAELDARYGEGVVTDPSATDAFLAECNEGQQHYDSLHQQELREESEPHQQLVNEAISDPANADKAPEEVIQTLADNSTTAKVQEIENSPAAQQDSVFVGGKCVEVQDKGGLICKNGIIPISSLRLLPNFKLGADSESGVKNPLPGLYYPDHDPIKVMQSKSGELIVFSGRHRLAKAKEAGVESINCYVYPESDNYSLAWAKKYDIELNIRDNQATPLETALYIRGEFTDGNPPDPATLAFINRKGSNGAKGWEIGTKAIPDVIDALRNNRIEDDIAVKIAQFCPNNTLVQQEGLKYALQGESTTTIRTAMEVALEMEKMKADLGLENQVDLWGNPIRDERFDSFVTKYLIKKRKELSEDTSILNNNVGKKGAAERREKHGITVADEAEAKQNLAAARDLQNRWKSPFQYADLRNEIYTAFRKAYPDAAEIPYFNAESDLADISTPVEDNLTGNLFGESFTASQADPTADFSLSAMHTADTAEADAAVEALGDLYPQTGRFHDQVQAYYPLRGEKAIDERIEKTIRMLVRRQQEIQSILNDAEESDADGLKLAYEGLALIRSLNNSLPNTRRFSLEPYENYFSMYAKLHGSGDAHDAAALANSEAWQDIMMRSFENRITEIAETSTLPDNDFWQLAYDQMPGLKLKIAALQKAFARISEDVNNQYEERINAALDAGNERKLETLRREIRNLIWAQLEAEHADKLDAAFRGFGLMRASRLLDKFLTRAAKQIDLYHKDIILGRITRAMNAIAPRKATDQNPQRGKISPENWRKAQDYYRLLLMTEAEKKAFEETHYTENEGEQSWESMTSDTLIKVPTFDHTGTPITITCTRQEYDVYASFRAMTTSQADAAAQSLGTFIKYGKEAWNIAMQQHKQRVQQIADDFIARYGQNWSEANKRVSKDRNSVITQRRKLLNLVGSFFNEGQFLRVLESPDLFGETATEWSHAAARANEYIESRETVTDSYVTNAISNILGLDMSAIDHNTREKNRAAIRTFVEKINKVKDSGITLTTQMPDFQKQQTSILREQLLRRLNFETRKKNYSPSKLAAAVEYIYKHPEKFTKEIAQEIYQKYGRLGNLEAYIKRRNKLGQTRDGACAAAFADIFSSEKYKHLADIVSSSKRRAEEQRKKYIEQHGKEKLDQNGNPVKDKNGNIIREWTPEITALEISPSQAAYHVLICEQPTYADSMARLGYTPEVVRQLREYADKTGAMQLGYQLREAMNERVDTIAQIYESIFGLPFPREEKYFRAFFQPRVSEKNDFEAQQLGYGSAGTQAITILYTRNHRTAPIAPGMGLMEAFFAGMKMQDVLIGYADPANGTTLPMMLRSLMSSRSGSKDMHEALKNALGETGYKQLRQHIDDMNAIAPSVDSAASKLNLFMRRLGSSGALGFLNFRLSSLAKQCMADFNTLLGTDAVTIKEWSKARARFLTGNTKISLKEMLQQDFIKSRYKGYEYTAQHEAYTAGPDVIVTQGTSPHTVAGMTAMEKYDAYHTARSSVFLYDAVYRKLEKEQPHMSHQDKHDAAMAECRLALTRKGQPQNFRQRSLEQRKASFMSLGNFFLGGESINTASSILSMLARGNKGDFAKSAFTWILQGAGIQAINAIYHFATDDEETRRRRNISGYLWGTLLGPLAGLPLISNLAAMVTGAAREAVPREYRAFMPHMYATSTIPGADLERTVRDIHKAFSKKNASAFDKAIAINAGLRDLFILGLALNSSPRTGGAATVKATSKIATGISNAIDFILRALRAADERL